MTNPCFLSFPVVIHTERKKDNQNCGGYYGGQDKGDLYAPFILYKDIKASLTFTILIQTNIKEENV